MMRQNKVHPLPPPSISPAFLLTTPRSDWGKEGGSDVGGGVCPTERKTETWDMRHETNQRWESEQPETEVWLHRSSAGQDKTERSMPVSVARIRQPGQSPHDRVCVCVCVWLYLARDLVRLYAKANSLRWSHNDACAAFFFTQSLMGDGHIWPWRSSAF